MIDVERLARWMDDVGLPGKGEPVEHRFVSGGTQNEIYEIRRGDLHCAMRIPPPSAPAGRDEGILPRVAHHRGPGPAPACPDRGRRHVRRHLVAGGPGRLARPL